jgi:IS30 family transposase
VTFDNGKEFALHALIAATARRDVYFAHPYRSWERGTSENRNGLIRRLHPKRSSFAGIGDAEIARIESYVNDRPHKCLGWRTPREAMAPCLA